MEISIENVIRVFLVLGFLPLLIFNEYEETAFSNKFSCFFFNSFLMLKVFKLQIISDRNVNKKILHKNYLKLSQDNPSSKSSLRKLDLSCGIETYHFEGVL